MQSVGSHPAPASHGFLYALLDLVLLLRFVPACRVICMDCGDNTCRHDLQQRLSALNPAFAERVAELSSSGSGSRGAWQRALRAGTAADARKVVQESREATEQVGTAMCCRWGGDSTGEVGCVTAHAASKGYSRRADRARRCDAASRSGRAWRPWADPRPVDSLQVQAGAGFALIA